MRRIESNDQLGCALYPHKIPLPTECHPELDNSPLLDDSRTKLYQMLIGTIQWACVVGRLDVCFAVSSLSRFSANPRQNHLKLALHVISYLKRHPNRRIVVDSNQLQVDPELQQDNFHPDFLEDYADAEEDIPTDLPPAFGSELETSIFFDSDHAHDVKTHRSISGLILFVGSTPVAWHSRRQGCIATSTYCAEFLAMRSATEEAISLRYMLRCLGIPVSKSTALYGDNWGAIQSANIPDSELKKKHIAISYHFVREAIAARIINPIWLRLHENYSDICTKALAGPTFNGHIHELMA